jgi:hypothetical protein
LWSQRFFPVVLLSIILFVTVVVLSALRLRRAKYSSSAKLVDIAILFWGTAYILEANAEPVRATRIATLNVFGSSTPAAACLDWFSLLLVFLALVSFAAPRLRPKWLHFGLAIGSVCILLIVLEGALRLKVMLAPSPGADFSNASWSRLHVHLNGKGWRDVDHTIARSPGTRRLLVIGDSFAFGWGIPQLDARLGEQTAAKLTNMTGEHWESINASIQARNTLDEITFVKQMLPYHADVVLLIYVFNDIDYVAPEVSFRLSPIEQYYPWWVLYRNSYLAQEVIARVRLLDYRLAGWPHSDPYMNAALVSRHLQDVSRFIAIAGQDGALVKVVPFDLPSAPYYRDRYTAFIQQAETAGIPVCSLQHTFDGQSLQALTLNAIDAHPNELANRLAADSVVRCLAQDGIHGASSLAPLARWLTEHQDSAH